MNDENNTGNASAPVATPEETPATPELTYGQKAVGITFNPSGDAKVNEVKELYAKIIDICAELRTGGQNEKSRLLSMAISQAQIAQMCAVKGITWTD